MNCSDKKSEPRVTDTSPRRRGNGWGGVAAIILVFAVLHLCLAVTTDKLGYSIGGTCLLAIAVILLAAPRPGGVSERPVETPAKRRAGQCD